MESPRIHSDDSIDPFLSRYNVSDAEKAVDAKLVRLRWRGFLPAAWVAELWMKTLSMSSDWFFLVVHGFEGRSFTILREPQAILQRGLDGSHTQARDGFVLWDVEGP